MGLAQVQQVLVRLYTDATFREAFFVDPTTSTAAFALTPEDLAHLQQIPHEQITSFATSLINKRFHEIRRLLPLTCQLLAKSCKPLFLRFAEQSVPTGIQKHHEDACTFVRWLASEWDALDLPAWAAEVAMLEANSIEFVLQQQRWRCCLFRYPIRDVVRGLKSGQLYTSGKRPTFFVWVRFGKQHTRNMAFRLL